MTRSAKDSSGARAGDPASAMEDEFDVVAGWTSEAIKRLGADHALPAACRGTSSPDMLAWLGEACGLSAGQLLLDVGGGMGGPAAYAAERFAVRPIVADPMPQACRAATELFEIQSVIASGSRLPVQAGSIDVAWCLGVLCTTGEKTGTLAELRRILRAGGSLGLMVLTADEPHPRGAPQGNVFPSLDELKLLLTEAGLDLVGELDATGIGEAPRAWTEPLARVKDLVHLDHSDDPRMAAADDQEARMAGLFDSGEVRPWLLCATAHQ